VNRNSSCAIAGRASLIEKIAARSFARWAGRLSRDWVHPHKLAAHFIAAPCPQSGPKPDVKSWSGLPATAFSEPVAAFAQDTICCTHLIVVHQKSGKGEIQAKFHDIDFSK
jgi:hypothetical protein